MILEQIIQESTALLHKARTLWWSRIISYALALGPLSACSSSQEAYAGSTEEQAQVTVKAEQSNAQGEAFRDSAQRIVIVDHAGNPLSGVSVTAYTVEGKGDFYLAGNDTLGGGLAAYPQQRREGQRRYGGELNRSVTIRPDEGVTRFDHPSRDLLYDVNRWTEDQQYRCEGIYTTEELIQGRETTAKLIEFFDPSGLVSAIYDKIEWLIDHGFVDDLPAEQEWFVIEPENPTGSPLTIQRSLAQDVYGSQRYTQLNQACGGNQETRAADGGGERPLPQNGCTNGIESLLALCRDYYRWAAECWHNDIREEFYNNALMEVCIQERADFLTMYCERLQCADSTNCDQFNQCFTAAKGNN